jgi:hypothetical protein
MQVWRTLSTAQAQTHYITKAKEKRSELNRTNPTSRLRSHESGVARVCLLLRLACMPVLWTHVLS